MRLVPILDEHGKEQLVNPEFVTSVIHESFEGGKNWRKLWVVGQSGYHTFSIITYMSMAEVKALLEGK